VDESCHKILHKKYGKIMKISGLPGGKNMVLIFDPDETEKVSFTRKVYRLITTNKRVQERIKCIGMFRCSEMKYHGP